MDENLICERQMLSKDSLEIEFNLDLLKKIWLILS